jgi:hypothetical protein
LIQEHKTIETVLEKVRENNEDESKKQKFIIPDEFLYEESRGLFKQPDVITGKDIIEERLKWNKP